jgi:hypothetical protein
MKRTTHHVLTLSVSFTLLLIGILPWIPENNAFSTPESSLTAARQTSLTAASPISEESSNALSSVDAATTHVLQQGLETMQQVMTFDFFKSADSLATFYSQISKSVEIRPSSIPNAGLGLFARKNIKQNTIISLYPVHALGMEGIFVSNDEEYFTSRPSSTSPYLHCTDQHLFQRASFLQQAGLENDDPLYLDVNSNLPNESIWLSHMINDGATISSPSQETVLDYYKASKLAKNCIHIPFGPSPIIATVTTKKVKKGQEFLTTYGSTYWLGVVSNDTQDVVTITPEIQAQIQTTAVDLTKSMASVSVVYANQIKAFETEFNKLLL